MKDVATKFGMILKKLRTTKGLSQQKLSYECELDRNYISLMERGMRQPTLKTLFKLSAALGVTASTIIKELEKDAKSGK